MPRPVTLPWKCQGRGDCCRRPEVVVMTQEERDELLRQRPDINTTWYPDEDGMAVMKAHPCPFVSFGNRCLVYEFRPYNCRRFQCYREQGEPYEDDEDGNCLNLTDRLKESRPVRRDYATKQRKAQRWALAHGWKQEP